jgi:leader peptidase (prepilin peptidase)/N-methyltransferase
VILYILSLILGLVIGSFLNASLWRYEKRISLAGRSMCPKCKTKIAWYDNIPIVSYVILLGKCRHCKRPIPARYPLVEIITAMTFLLVSIYSSPGRLVYEWFNGVCAASPIITSQRISLDIVSLSILLIIFSLLIFIAIYDLRTKEIPNGFSLSFALLSFMYTAMYIFGGSASLKSLYLYLLTAIVAFMFFYGFVYFSKETWMGGGDAKLAFGMGLLLGPINTFLAILLASWVGASYGVGLMIFKKAGRKTEVPFGPFLVLGTLVSLLFGSQLIRWYVKIFLGI